MDDKQRPVFYSRNRGYAERWRLGPESNRGRRLCRPQHNHSATQPLKCITGTDPGSVPVREPGAGNETRTRDPNLGKVVLYQLSYSRVARGAVLSKQPIQPVKSASFTGPPCLFALSPSPATTSVKLGQAARKYRNMDQTVNPPAKYSNNSPVRAME